MDLHQYTKQKAFEKSRNLLFQQKYRSSKDPFEGDPFKTQSLNFRYADKPSFYPETPDPAMLMRNSRTPSNISCLKRDHYFCPEELEGGLVNSNHQQKERGYSSVFSLSNFPKSEKNIQNSTPRDGGGYPKASKNSLNRTRSVYEPSPIPSRQIQNLTQETQRHTRRATLKERNNADAKRKNLVRTAIKLDDCNISIEINGVMRNKLKKNDHHNTYNFCGKNEDPNRVPRELHEPKNCRSYIVNRDAGDRHGAACSSVKKSSYDLLRESSTHSIIPHKENSNIPHQENNFYSASPRQENNRSYKNIALAD